MYSPAQIKAILITPMITGSVSTVASVALITAILKSETKLSVPSKRILFGLCVHDSLLSLSAALSSLPIPKGQGVWGAIGNGGTCDFQGFISHIGFVGSALYNCNLSIYYLCVIRFSMSDASFRQKIEPFCHIIPNLYALGGAIYLLSKGYFNNIGNLCWIGPYPIDCINNPEVECLRGDENAYLFRWIFLGYAVYVVWAIIIITMISIVFMVATQRRRSERWASGGGSRKDSKQSLANNDISCFTNLANGSASKQADASTDTPLQTDSAKSLKECKDPLVFDLKAMRTKTRRQSLISSKTPPAETIEKNAPPIDKYSDPHPFDLKTVRAAGRTSIRSAGQREALGSLNSNRNPAPTQQQARHSLKERVSFRHSDVSNLSSFNETNEGDATSSRRISRSSLRSSGRRSIGSRQDSQKRGPSLDEASREVKKQALLYILSFVVCWVFPIITRLLEEREKKIPFIIFELARIFNPIQGMFNILVYVRPYVRGLRSHHPEYSWWKAFCLTVKSGGDNNAPRGDRSSLRNSRKPNQKVLEKIRQNHIERMESIRQKRRSFTHALRRSSISKSPSSPSKESNFILAEIHKMDDDAEKMMTMMEEGEGGGEGNDTNAGQQETDVAMLDQNAALPATTTITTTTA